MINIFGLKDVVKGAYQMATSSNDEELVKGAKTLAWGTAKTVLPGLGIVGFVKSAYENADWIEIMENTL